MARGLIVVAVCLAACATPPGHALVEEDLPRRVVNDGKAPLTVLRVHDSPAQTINVLRIDGPVAAHRHLHSQETVYVISGKGALELEGATREVEAGDLVILLPNTLHGFTPLDGPAVVLSIFGPPLREGDRVLERDR